MTKLRNFSLLSIALIGLTACGMASDSGDEVFLITHTTKGTLYWE